MRLQHSVISHLIRVYEERERLMNILDLTVSVKPYPRLLMNANANFQIPHLVKKKSIQEVIQIFRGLQYRCEFNRARVGFHWL